MASITMQRSVRGRRPSLFTTISHALTVWRQRRHLEDLDAHLRRDIGLSEADILRETDRGLWGLPQNRTW